MPEKIIQEKVRLGVLCLRCLIAVTRKKAELFIVYNLERNPLPNQLKKGVVQESPSRLAIANYIADKAGDLVPAVTLSWKSYSQSKRGIPLSPCTQELSSIG